MIENTEQLIITEKWIKRFQAAAKLKKDSLRLMKAEIDAIESQIRDLETEALEYKKSKGL